MGKDLWNKCQQLTESGRIDLAMPMLIKEFQDNLTEEQINKLGDIPRILANAFSKKRDVTVEQFVRKLIKMTQDGYIIAHRN